jgi:YesN/AraC family two-component response regulator
MARVLLIDDDELVRATLRNLLKQAGHEVATADNGRDALDRERKVRFDLVITDILMPEMEGIETILALKNASPTMRVIAISGGGRTGNLEFLKMAGRLGANETLRKPFSAEELLAAVQRVLSAK